MTEQASTIITLGRALAEQYHRDPGANQLAYLAYPAHWKQAMQAAADEEQYYSKCQALGISTDAAQQILADTIAVADKGGLPMGTVWERAWQQAIEQDSPMSSSLGRDPWQQLRTSRGTTRQEIDAIKDALLAMASGAPNSDAAASRETMPTMSDCPATGTIQLGDEPIAVICNLAPHDSGQHHDIVHGDWTEE
jgi:hypothetical protein